MAFWYRGSAMILPGARICCLVYARMHTAQAVLLKLAGCHLRLETGWMSRRLARNRW